MLLFVLDHRHRQHSPRSPLATSSIYVLKVETLPRRIACGPPVYGEVDKHRLHSYFGPTPNPGSSLESYHNCTSLALPVARRDVAPKP